MFRAAGRNVRCVGKDLNFFLSVETETETETEIEIQIANRD